ncbi:FAD-binding oxidoreductase [Propioniciclava coleopterorum]|uniref:D-lactate dehydrogenase (cytochrome) n=1 Tax=Propioniciclava coleopterorum TaxID=2714937 RepID=A0A6G7Y371_9ACTN|nr:FAD-binding and (Fe-S)-binding domain-containing protein [Propioniciclava coleopterorum]QIK71136.1 FAD-binding oxidoreductase [Propioniciclava coleopterorum]
MCLHGGHVRHRERVRRPSRTEGPPASKRARRALRHRPAPAAPDALGPEVLDGALDPLAAELTRLLGADDVLTSASDLIRYSSDASPYRLLPRVVVRPRDPEQLRTVLAAARRAGRGVTFRAGGTSLNGQSQGDDVLVDMREHFRDVSVLDDGARLRAQPGVILARANALLARRGRMLGPDPASSGAATIGGVLANNASGMTCGTRYNSYTTLDSLVAVLASGTVVDTGAPDADARLRADEPELHAALEAIRDDLRADAELTALIRRKFAIKNTSGYRLDAFLDADRPADILTLLLVGSEGTLGAVVDTTWRTLETGPMRSTAFLRFPDVATAAAVVAPLNDADAQAVELMDAASLRSLQGRAGTPAWIDQLATDATDAAILTERRATDEAALERFEADLAAIVTPTVVAMGEPLTTRDPREAAVYWRLRSGMLPSIGASRPDGTALITEDVVVPPQRLPEAVVDLQRLLVTHGFVGAVNGHASAGNLHFYLYLDATDDARLASYRAFMEDLVDLIVDRYEGSLKGEHGTGRNMAPYLGREWGEAAVAAMWRVKRALDPAGLLGPGVFLNEDPEAAFTDLKSMPAIHDHLNPCIECGFCEPVCPSRHLTSTPRQRIVLQRELARQGYTGPVAQRITDEYAYEAVDTCAGDSSCAIACPVDIDTGRVMKELRRDGSVPLAQGVGVQLARHWGAAEVAGRFALRAAQLLRPVVGDRGLSALTSVGRRIGGEELVPSWVAELPGPAPRLPATTRDGAEAVFFAACINRIFGASKAAAEPTTVSQAFVALADRAGHPVWLPDDVEGLCCGTVWHSKGLEDGNRIMAARVLDRMWSWSQGGRLPIVVDASSCTLGLAHDIVELLDPERATRHAQLRIVDVLRWTREVLLPDLPRARALGLAVVHPTCSMNTLGITEDLAALAGAVSEEVFVPVSATCCAFAGDRGMLHPELTATATEEEVAQVAERLAQPVAGEAGFVSGNRTCELGMEHATGRPYESVIVTLERLTR